VPDLNALVALQTLKMLKKMSRKMGDGDETDSEGSDEGVMRGGEPDFAGINNMRKRFCLHPERFVPAYTPRTKSDLGVRDPRQVWRFTDNGKRMRGKFGTMSGMFQVSMYVLEIIQFHADGEAEKGGALAVQLAKAIHQMAIDKGSWENAVYLIPLEEPGERSRFGGDERELKSIYKYKRSMRELRLGGKKDEKGGDHGDEGDDEPNHGGDKDKAGGGKNGMKGNRNNL